jgi:ribosomal protein S18 acetylase RimI-like enzyme
LNGVVHFERLGREVAVAEGAKLLALSADQPWENWSIDNLIADRPSKWTLSMVARIAGEPIGYVIASVAESRVHIHRLVVGADHRRRGVGERLIRLVAATAESTGAKTLTLKVHQTNRSAADFYARLGFTADTLPSNGLLLLSAAVDTVTAPKSGTLGVGPPLCLG